MASALVRRARGSAAALWGVAERGLASVGSDIVSAAPGVSLQKAQSWDEAVATKFSTTPLKDIFYVRRSTSTQFLCYYIARPPGPPLPSDPSRFLVFAGEESGYLRAACKLSMPFPLQFFAAVHVCSTISDLR